MDTEIIDAAGSNEKPEINPSPHDNPDLKQAVEIFAKAAKAADPTILNVWLHVDLYDRPGEIIGVTFNRNPSPAGRKAVEA